MRTCASCGRENAEDARFCSACGELLAPATPAIPELRKIVTVLFCDVVGSTTIAEGMDPESWSEVMARYFSAMRKVLEARRGRVEKFVGDAVLGVFGLPVTGEDDTIRAVDAAFEMRRVLVDLNRSFHDEFGVTLRIRTGLNTGEAVAAQPTAEQALPLGDVANVASRLEQAALV